MQDIFELPQSYYPASFTALSKPPQKLYYCGREGVLDELLLEQADFCIDSMQAPQTLFTQNNIESQNTPKAKKPKISRAPKPKPKNAPKVAIVGTRAPNPYTKAFVAQLSSLLCAHNAIVVSGGALGVDIIAHTHAMPRTIMFSPSSLEIIYPKSNASVIKQIMRDALVLSEYEHGYMPKAYSFLERNRLVIALSDCVVIPQADMGSGSMQSAKMALKLGKPVFVLPQRIGESEGSNQLLAQDLAYGIYDIYEFVEGICSAKCVRNNDEILSFCANNPSFEEAYERFGEKLYEYELEGKIRREAGKICVV